MAPAKPTINRLLTPVSFKRPMFALSVTMGDTWNTAASALVRPSHRMPWDSSLGIATRSTAAKTAAGKESAHPPAIVQLPPAAPQGRCTAAPRGCSGAHRCSCPLYSYWRAYCWPRRQRRSPQESDATKIPAAAASFRKFFLQRVYNAKKFCYNTQSDAPVAQWIEHQIPVLRVGGSSPFWRTIAGAIAPRDPAIPTGGRRIFVCTSSR